MQTAATTQSRRYCQDCRFFATSPQGKQYGKCGNPLAGDAGPERFIAPEFVRNLYAGTCRDLESKCGPGAAWFEPYSPAPVAVEAA